MACLEFANTQTNKGDNITDALRRIDKMQKDAINANRAGTCNSCVIAPLYNTIPIAIYLCNNVLTATTQDATEANRFRVEEVKNDVVILRLLTVNGTELTCTTNTLTCKIGCICCIQCFDPITCPVTCPNAL